MNEIEKMYENADVENQFTSCELDHCAIDKLYSNLWQDLTEAEKAQIKEILE